MKTDRVAGLGLALLAIAVVLEAMTFEVAFLTDPVGPKALPFVTGGILLVSGLYLVARPGPEPDWPHRDVLIRLGAATVAFTLYALLLQPLGFVVATVMVVTALGLLFGGALRQSLMAATALSATLWYLFVWALGLSLPLGGVWEALWMR